MAKNVLKVMMLARVLTTLTGCSDGGDDDPSMADGAVADGASPDVHVAVDSGPDAPPACVPAKLNGALAWYGMNRERLQDLVDTRGCGTPGYDAQNKPVALFDWDNTVTKNDVGDAVTFWMVANDKIKQPAGHDWGTTSRYLSADAKTALSGACGTTVAAGAILPTSTNTACADEILAIYTTGKTSTNLNAFTGWNYRRMEPTYAWAAQLLSGYTPSEVRAFSSSAITQNLTAAVGATQTIGTKTLNGYLRVYDQIKDLIDVLQKSGFAVWVITASPQQVVEAFAPMVNVDPSRVVGIRSLLDGAGKLTPHFEGCGTVPASDDSMITYIEGKRCWVNKIVYGDASANAMQRRPNSSRQLFGAGDSDTDIEFLRDATVLKLVVNRNKKEIMCHAYNNAGGGWIVNPMFIAPRAMQTSPYACAVDACKDAAGVGVPCSDDLGRTIPNLPDTAY